uniref:Haloacid dehalogenase like hydrolase domain containing 5 n=1 Tax=Takifugu rubripes TaxID=31033 RepID=A0A674NRL4_TAKRU
MDTQVVMWCRSVLQSLRLMSTSRKVSECVCSRVRVCVSPVCPHQVGVLFDVDGVLLRGGSVIPAAHRAFRKLVDKNNNFLLPVVFVTNAGSCQRHHKATQLSQLLEVQISPEQVVLSYSPLQMFKSFHEKCVLVSGQGPLTDIAKSLGFQKVLTMEQLREGFPLLDMVDHNRTARPVSGSCFCPNSACLLVATAIILFGEPIRWETNLQLLIDVLLTDGNPASVYDHQLPVQLPVLSCNMDLVWMAEHCMFTGLDTAFLDQS